MSRRYWMILLVCGLLLVPLIVAMAITRPDAVVGSALSRIVPPQSQTELGANDIAPSFNSSDMSQPAPLQQGLITGTYFWNYSAKFVCGFQPEPAAANSGEPVVKPANYATDINIHNYNYRNVTIAKKVIVLFQDFTAIGREPNAQKALTLTTAVMSPDSAMMDDCNEIYALRSAIPPPYPPPLMTGYLVILSPLDLDIDVVYTANLSPSISIDVERVPGKRVYIPANCLNTIC